MRYLTLFVLLSTSGIALAQGQPINQVLLAPLFEDPYVCSEHAVGELPYPGDDLGQDCMVAAFDQSKDAKFMRLYKTNGLSNADWYGWNKPVHSPCDCEIAKIYINPKTNKPGFPDKSRASAMLLKQADGTLVMLGHMQNVLVKEGDQLKAGQVIASIGNNGYARAPHIHIGAWRGKESLQIRWDQRKMKVH